MAELWARSACQLASALRAKEISSSELLAEFLARIELLDPKLNAVVTLDVERARKAAVEADDAIVRGQDLGPLHGLPITVKDALETSGMRSTGGAEELSHHVPTVDAPAVARVRHAGAVIFGKTNVPKWSGDSQTRNEIFGITRNPWDPFLSPGGSSGGPAVSVACGFTAFELGTDIGGSIRMPAHFTGICGHKPSFGIVPSRGYLDHVGGGLTEADINVVGPLARSVADLEVVLEVLVQSDLWSPGGWHLELPPVRSEMRVGAWLDDDVCPVDEEVLSILERAVKGLENIGAKIDPHSRPVDFGQSMRLFLALISSAVSPGLDDEIFELAKGMESIPEEPGEDPLLKMSRGVSMRHRDWIAFDEERELLRRQWASWFEDHDVLLCPVGPVAAQPLSDEDLFNRKMIVNGVERSANDLIFWPGLTGVAYLPATVVPVGRNAAGLPVGIQVVAPYLGDLTALFVARRLEEIFGGYEPPPIALEA